MLLKPVTLLFLFSLVSYFGFIRLDLSPWGYKHRCSLILRYHVIVRVLCIKVCLRRYFWCCGYTWGSCVLYVTTDEFWERVAKYYFKDSCLISSEPTFLILCHFLTQYKAILKNTKNPDKFESQTFLRLCEGGTSFCIGLSHWNSHRNASAR